MRMVNVFSRSTLSAPPSALSPGTWVFGAGMALGRKVLRSNTAVNVFHRGFVACDSYAGGEAAMAQLTCPVLIALGSQDQMLVEAGNSGHGRNYAKMQLQGDFLDPGTLVNVRVSGRDGDTLLVERQ